MRKEMTGPLSNMKFLGEHYTISKSAGSMSGLEFTGIIVACLLFYLGGKLKIPDKWRFPLAILIIFICCMVD
jgi:hypothetical protein